MQRHSGIVPKTKCMHIYTCGVRLHLSYLQVNASPSEHDVTRKTNKVTYTALRSARYRCSTLAVWLVPYDS